jgi:PilZ domain
MPRQLRCFDHAEEQYKVWAVVRWNVRLSRPTPRGPAASRADERTRFEVGVAFVGKRPPASYERDPSLRYEVKSLAPDGSSYALVERQPPARGAAGPSGRTMETRLTMPMDIIVEAFDERGEVQMREQTVTENISRHGASVWTTLQVERGRFVRLTSAAQGLSVTAAVRARRAGADGVMRLHLEFTDREWPLEGLE